MNEFRKRGRLLVAKKFQVKYIGFILGFMFFVVIVTGYIVYATTWIMFGEKLAAVYPQGLLLDIVKKVNMVLLIRMLLLTPLVILIGLIISNRMAGPIYHIKEYLKKIDAGDYDKELNLRKKDELQDLAAEINHFVANLKGKRDHLREELSELGLRIDSIEGMVTGRGDNDAEIRAKIRDVKKRVEELSRT